MPPISLRHAAVRIVAGLAAAALNAALLAPATRAQEEIVETFEDGSVWLKYRIDGEGRLNGLYVEYHENGKIALKANYKRDLLHGGYNEYDEKGRSLLATVYRDDEIHGDYSSWDPETDLREKAKYREGQLEGTRTFERGKKEISRQTWSLSGDSKRVSS